MSDRLTPQNLVDLSKSEATKSNPSAFDISKSNPSSSDISKPNISEPDGFQENTFKPDSLKSEVSEMSNFDLLALARRRPILTIGLGLSFGLWAWEGAQDMAIASQENLLLVAIGAGALVWWRSRQKAPNAEESMPLVVDRAAADREISRAEATLKCLLEEHPNPEKATGLEQRLQLLQGGDLAPRIGIVGSAESGVAELGDRLQALWQQKLEPARQNESTMDTPELLPELVAAEPLFQPETDDEPILASLLDCDGILFLAAEDLTDSEFQVLEVLAENRQRSLLFWSRAERCRAEERDRVWVRLQQRAAGLVGISAIPPTDTPVDVTVLGDRLQQFFEEEKENLALARVWRQARGLRQQAKAQLDGIRRDRALPAIERAQWIAAAAAFANPVPALDLLATGAVQAQLAIDLGKIYQHSFSLDRAREIAKTLATAMLQLGLVELSVKTIGDLLKTNAVTFVAGGALQGISAAYLTRVAGLGLIAYLQEADVEMDGETGSSSPTLPSLDRLRQTVRAAFQQTQNQSFLQAFVSQSIDRLAVRTQEN